MSRGTFKPGDPRPPNAGRKKGTLNRNTQLLFDKAEELGVDPFEVVLLFAKGDWKSLGYKSASRLISAKGGDVIEVDTISPEMRLSAAERACSYLYPKPKAVTLSNEDGSPIFPSAQPLTFEQQRELLKIARGEK